MMQSGTFKVVVCSFEDSFLFVKATGFAIFQHMNFFLLNPMWTLAQPESFYIQSNKWPWFIILNSNSLTSSVRNFFYIVLLFNWSAVFDIKTLFVSQIFMIYLSSADRFKFPYVNNNKIAITFTSCSNIISETISLRFKSFICVPKSIHLTLDYKVCLRTRKAKCHNVPLISFQING